MTTNPIADAINQIATEIKSLERLLVEKKAFQKNLAKALKAVPKTTKKSSTKKKSTPKKKRVGATKKAATARLKKTSAKKVATKKVTAKKATAKKATAKKTVAKKTVAKKTPKKKAAKKVAKKTASGLRSGSTIDSIYQAISKGGAPQHIGQIMAALGKKDTPKNRRSVVASVTHYVRAGKTFRRTAPNTFGLLNG